MISTIEQRRTVAPFWASLIADFISLAGNRFTAIAVPWYVLATTGSAAKMGIVGFVGLVPTVIAAAFGGALVDRVGHKRISVFADIVSGLSVAAIPLLDMTIGIQFWQLLALVFAGALFDSPGGTARSAMYPDLANLGGVSLERANSLTSISQNLNNLLIPPLAGIAIAALGASHVLWLDAASFAISAAVYWAVVPSFHQIRETAEPYWTQVKAGLSFLRQSRLLTVILLLSAFINMLTAPLFGLAFAVLAKDVYGSSRALGWMLGAEGLGAVASLAIYSSRGAGWSRRRTVVFGFFLFCLPILVVAATSHLWLVAVALAISGIGIGPTNPVIFTILQERTPVELRGRVFGGVIACALVASPLGMLVVGGVIQRAGARPVIFGIGVLLLAAGLLLANAKSLHDMDRRVEPA